MTSWSQDLKMKVYTVLIFVVLAVLSASARRGKLSNGRRLQIILVPPQDRVVTGPALCALTAPGRISCPARGLPVLTAPSPHVAMEASLRDLRSLRGQATEDAAETERVIMRYWYAVRRIRKQG